MATFCYTNTQLSQCGGQQLVHSWDDAAASREAQQPDCCSTFEWLDGVSWYMDINTDATNHTAQQRRQNHNGSCYISDADISASEPLCVAALLGFGIKNTLKYVTFQVAAHLKWIPAAPSWLLVPEPTRRSKCQLSYRAHSDIQLVTFFFFHRKQTPENILQNWDDGLLWQYSGPQTCYRVKQINVFI